jgi:hypothetical protein
MAASRELERLTRHRGYDGVEPSRHATGPPASLPVSSISMLSLQSASAARWLAQVDTHLEEVLIDHAHCEKKAAGVAMNLLFAYVDQTDLARAMTEIVTEELDLEVGLAVLPWLMPIVYAGYQVMGNVGPGKPFQDFFSYAPVIGIRFDFVVVHGHDAHRIAHTQFRPQALVVQLGIVRNQMIGRGQDVARSIDIGPEHGGIIRQPQRITGGHVEAPVAPGHRPGERGDIVREVPGNRFVGAADKPSDIRPRAQQRSNRMPSSNQCVNQVGSDKTRGTGDKTAHGGRGC